MQGGRGRNEHQYGRSTLQPTTHSKRQEVAVWTAVGAKLLEMEKKALDRTRPSGKKKKKNRAVRKNRSVSYGAILGGAEEVGGMGEESI